MRNRIDFGEKFQTFLKGLLMGGADIIPGVSGGTMALITGIYERLINGIKGLTGFLKPLCKLKFKDSFDSLKKIDFGLFIPLGLGIIFAFGIGSLIIPFLLDNYTAFVYAFFFGLVLASIKLVYKKIECLCVYDWVTGMIGFLLAFFILGLDVLKTTPSYGFIFICGMIAITAMLLPGISGSFMLLMLGQYKFMLESLKHFRIGYVMSFLSGAVLSLILFSYVVSYLLRKHHSKTMMFLVGLMLGALRLPVTKVWSTIDFGLVGVLGVVICFIIGIILVLVVGRYEE